MAAKMVFTLLLCSVFFDAVLAFNACSGCKYGPEPDCPQNCQACHTSRTALCWCDDGCERGGSDCPSSSIGEYKHSVTGHCGIAGAIDTDRCTLYATRRSGKCSTCKAGYYKTNSDKTCTKCASCPAGNKRVSCGGNSAGYCQMDNCLIARSAPDSDMWLAANVEVKTDLSGCDTVADPACALTCLAQYQGAPTLMCSRTGWRFEPCSPVCASFSGLNCLNNGCLPDPNTGACMNWVCPTPDGILTTNRQKADFSIGASSADPNTLRAVLTCAASVLTTSREQRNLISGIFGKVQAQCKKLNMVELEGMAASYVKGYWTPLTDYYVPALDASFFQSSLQNQIGRLSVLNNDYQSGLASRNFNTLFRNELGKFDDITADLQDEIENLAIRISNEENTKGSSLSEFLEVSVIVEEEVENLMTTVQLFAATNTLKSVFGFCGSALRGDFVGAAGSLGEIGTEQLELHRTMEEIYDLLRVLAADVVDYNALETGNTGAQWDALLAHINGIFGPICLHDEPRVRRQCFKNAYMTGLSIADLKREQAMTVLRLDRTQIRRDALQLQISAPQSGTTVESDLAYELLVDHLYAARGLLRSYCFSLRYKYPNDFAQESLCESMNALGGVSQLGNLINALTQLEAKKGEALLGSRDNSGAGDNQAIPFDITYKFDLNEFKRTKRQQFRFAVGELPFIFSKLNVEIEKVRIYFLGLATKTVRVDLTLEPPFFKQTQEKGQLTTHEFMLDALRQQFFYTLPTFSCPVEKQLADKWCVQDEWQSRSFTLPTPYAEWSVELPLNYAEELANITNVYVEMSWRFTDSIEGSDATVSMDPEEWTECDAAQTQERDIHCATNLFGDVHFQAPEFCQWYGMADAESSRCCAEDCEGYIAPRYASPASQCGSCVNSDGVGLCGANLTCSKDLCVDSEEGLQSCLGYGRVTSKEKWAAALEEEAGDISRGLSLVHTPVLARLLTTCAMVAAIHVW